jgi:hypothetical protein
MYIVKCTFNPQWERYTPNPPRVDDTPIFIFYQLVSDMGEYGEISIQEILLNPFDIPYENNVCYMISKKNRVKVGWLYDDEGNMFFEIDRNHLLATLKKWYACHLKDSNDIFIYRQGEFFDIQSNATITPNFNYSIEIEKKPYTITCYQISKNYYVPNIAPIADIPLWIMYELLQYAKISLRKSSESYDEPVFWTQFENVDIKDDKSFIRRPYSSPTAPPELVMNKDHLRDIINQWDDLSLRDAKEITIQRDGERFTIEGIV